MLKPKQYEYVKDKAHDGGSVLRGMFISLYALRLPHVHDTERSSPDIVASVAEATPPPAEGDSR